jgi:hypothetical protein
LSVAVNELTFTVRLAAVAGRVNAVTTGAVVSKPAAVTFTVTGACRAETLPAASFAQQ